MSLQLVKISNRKKVRLLMLRIFDVTKAIFNHNARVAARALTPLTRPLARSERYYYYCGKWTMEWTHWDKMNWECGVDDDDGGAGGGICGGASLAATTFEDFRGYFFKIMNVWLEFRKRDKAQAKHVIPLLPIMMATSTHPLVPNAMRGMRQISTSHCSFSWKEVPIKF